MKTVLITGASSGIGLAVATRMADSGWRVIGVARDSGRLSWAIGQLAGSGHAAHAFDVADHVAWEEVSASFDRLDGLVTAAAVLDPVGPIGSYGPADFLRTVEINLGGTLLAIHHSLDQLKAARGAVVTFSGGGGTSALPRYDAYAASKAAVVRLTENLAVDLQAHGVTINAVAPGFVATPIHRATAAAGREAAGAEYFDETQKLIGQGAVDAAIPAQLVEYLLTSAPLDVSGRLISATWDPWRSAEYMERLGKSPHLARLRRVDGRNITEHGDV